MKIAVVGMGKIGLPLAVQYAKKGNTVTGIDINPKTAAKIKVNRFRIWLCVDIVSILKLPGAFFTSSHGKELITGQFRLPNRCQLMSAYRCVLAWSCPQLVLRRLRVNREGYEAASNALF